MHPAAANEEEVKTKIVLPYLKGLGLQPSDLSFEKSFSLQIGTNKVLVNGAAPGRRVVGGRLDILVRRHGANLFILELKDADHALTDEDRDQAVSYARLVHPIAPYAILTNGVDWQIFDAISKALLKSEDFKIKDVYRLALPDADRDAATSYFLGYSIENLLQFCRQQVAEHLRPLTGSPQDLTRKYIPELTTPRAGLLAALAAFESGPSGGFLLLADSGHGKTSALCDYVRRRLAQEKPTLFFAGATLESGLLTAITAEFGWTFSEELTPIMLIRRLSELAKDAPVVVVIDAIDEWPYAQRAQHLLSVLRGSREYRVKFVFSCRTAVWESISQPFGSDLGFAPYLFSPVDAGEPKEAYRLGPLTNPEFYGAVRNYREVFQFNGGFEDKALQEARLNPFLLRVMFAVAADSGVANLTFSSRVFFERYFELLLKKCGHRESMQAETQILALAQLLFDRNEDAVSETEVRRALDIPVNETLLPALLEQNILQRRGDRYAFYFQHLLNYLIAFRVCRWDSAKPVDLAAVKRNGVQLDALAFYLRYASPEQLQAVTDPIWTHAHEYLTLYSTLVGRYFSQLERELVPGDGPELGFVGEYVVHRHVLGGYGFRRREPNEPRVLLVPVDEYFSKSNLLRMTGANSLHHVGTSNGFLALDIRREVVEHELIAGVKQAIERRRLSLRGSEKLAAEALLAAIYHDRRTFASFLDPLRGTLRFPISVKDARETVQRAKLRCHFEHEVIEEKRRRGTLKEEWSGNFVSYDPKLSDEEESRVAAAIDDAISTARFPVLRAVTINLRDLERALLRTGVFEDLASIERAPWRTESGLCAEISRNSEAGMNLVREHVRALYEEFLRAYRLVVDTNFPALKNSFPLRARMPVRLFLDVQPELSESRYSLDGGVVSVWQRRQDGDDDEVVLCSPGELEIGSGGVASYRRQVLPDVTHDWRRLERHTYSMGQLLLTDMVYSRIGQEWPGVANAIRRAEGPDSNSATDTQSH